MGKTTRVTAEQAATETDDWSGGTAPEVSDVPVDSSAQMGERLAAQEAAADQLGWAMHQIAAGQQVIATHLAKAMEKHTDEYDYSALAQTVDWLQTVKRSMGEFESYAARELGRLDSTPPFIELPDGRRAEVMKGRERKEWRHEDWKHDVRAKVAAVHLSLLPDTLVDPNTGEELNVAPVVIQAISDAQAVHGSTAPKVTAMKELGLSADDYCTSGPGPYSVKISAPSTTTEEN